MHNRTAISSLLALLPLISLSPSLLAADNTDSRPQSELAAACQPYTSDETGDNLQEQDSISNSDGVFWRIDGQATTPSYILGTMHSQDRKVTNLTPPQRLHLAQSDRLLIEVEPDQQANQAYLDAIYEQDGKSLKSALPAVMYQRLERISEAYGLPPEKLEQLEPWAAFSQVGRPKPVNGPTQDIVIYQTAVRMNKPIIGLETMPELVRTLDSLPYADQITILKDTICNHTRIVRESKTLLDLYLRGDLAGMVAFNRQPHYDEAVFERFMQAVVYDRNQRMFERLRPYLKKGSNFIALGALHLPEDKGLLALIEDAGYSVTPVR